MISKTIKYVDYNGIEKEETFWFNMSRTDLMRMEASEEGGWEQRLRKMIAEKDAKKAYLFFEKFIQESYGVISPDGGFDKDERHYKSSVRRPPMTISSGTLSSILMRRARLLMGSCPVLKEAT